MKITVLLREDPMVWEKFKEWKNTRFKFYGRLADMKRVMTNDGGWCCAWLFDRCWPWSAFLARRMMKGKATVIQGWV